MSDTRYGFVGAVLVLIFIVTAMFIDRKYFQNSSVDYCNDQCNNNDTLLLAKIMFSECSVCTTMEALLIGSVVLNRVKDGRWGSTIDSVVHSVGQFHGVDSKNWYTDSTHYKLAVFLMTFGPISKVPIYFNGKTDKDYINRIKPYKIQFKHSFSYD